MLTQLKTIKSCLIQSDRTNQMLMFVNFLRIVIFVNMLIFVNLLIFEKKSVKSPFDNVCNVNLHCCSRNVNN